MDSVYALTVMNMNHAGSGMKRVLGAENILKRILTLGLRGQVAKRREVHLGKCIKGRNITDSLQLWDT